MIKYTQVQQLVDHKVSVARSFQYYIGTEKFHALWRVSNDEKKKKILNAIANDDMLRFKRLLKAGNLQMKTLAELRKLAKELGIDGWHKLTKAQLIEVLL